MRNAVVVLFSIGLVCACSGPMGPIAGGTLEGDPAAWPEDWAFTNDTDNVLLQTCPQDPYSVTTWAVTTNGNLYIAAANSKATWVKNIADDNAVIVSVNGELYDATASIVTEREEIADVVQAYVVKYEFDSQEDFIEEEGVLFRLSKP